jgi:hypothetical protein
MNHVAVEFVGGPWHGHIRSFPSRVGTTNLPPRHIMIDTMTGERVTHTEIEFYRPTVFVYVTRRRAFGWVAVPEVPMEDES